MLNELNCLKKQFVESGFFRSKETRRGLLLGGPDNLIFVQLRYLWFVVMQRLLKNFVCVLARSRIGRGSRVIK